MNLSTIYLSTLIAFSVNFMPQTFLCAQETPSTISSVRTLPIEVVAEDGCPVQIVSARAEFDLDAFGTPIDSRTYIDYKNVSDKLITGVKFRLRFADADGRDRGTFQAPDAAQVGPGMQGSQKWKHERIYPLITQAKVRVLQVLFSDANRWDSVKLPEVEEKRKDHTVDANGNPVP
jgi:hypothetical protein